MAFPSAVWRFADVFLKCEFLSDLRCINFATDIIIQNSPDIGIGRRDLHKLFMFATSQTYVLLIVIITIKWMV